MQSRLYLRRAVVLALLLTLIAPVGASWAAPSVCFSETKQCLDDHFQTFWQRNGALPVFGFPLASAQTQVNQDTQQTYLTQWFERHRLEWHPENADPYRILLGRLGAERLRQQGRDWHTFPPASPQALHYFVQTAHAIAPQFWNYWRSYGLDLGDQGISERESVALFDFPLSEPQMETNSSGDTVLTQWFERARFEYHPELAVPYQVLLGRLGSDVYAFHTPQQLGQNVVGLPAVGGSVLAWSEGSGEPDAPTTQRAYDFDTQLSLHLPAAIKQFAVTDGMTIAWPELQGGSTPGISIVGYDLHKQTTFTILPAGEADVIDFTLSRGVLYYSSDTEPHRGIFARVVATGAERQLTAQFGRTLVVADDSLLWSDEAPATGAADARSILHLIKLQGSLTDSIVKQDAGKLAGYGVAGDYVVWANANGAVQLYHISTGATTTLPMPLVGQVTQVAIAGDHVIWGMRMADGSTSVLVEYTSSTNTTRTITTSPSLIEPWAIVHGTTLVYEVFTTTATGTLYAVDMVGA